MEGCSVRRISERAGVSTGLINYHFSSIHDLVAAAYSHLAFTFLNGAIESCQADGDSPRRQLSIFIGEIFSSQVMQRRVLRAWVVFWGLIDSSPTIAAAQADSNNAFSKFLQTLFDGVDAQASISCSPRLAAIGLTALIDGLWLEWCLQPDAFNSEECVQLCEQWVDGLSS